MKTQKNEKIINKEKNSSILKLMQPFQKFIQAESFSGFLLLIFTAAALIWANSAFSGTYINLWHSEVTLGFKEFIFTKDFHFYINDVLMSVFFFVVGLEIKRELIDGELSSARKAALPILAAAGGMLFPALIYTAFNFGSESSHGWGIPTATDIAFAIGILSLLGSRVSLGLKVFLTALAIADDMGAVLIIAVFYTAGLVIPWLIAGIVVFGLLLLLNKLNVYSISAYAALGVILWIALYNTGVHPTIAGVLTAAAIPAGGKITFDKTPPLVQPPLKRLEDLLHPWVAFFIMPLFALANAGVVLKGDFLSSFSNNITMGVMAGLIFGKPIGITLLSFIAFKLKLAQLPEGENWKRIFGAGMLGGIGFTMSIFISGLAFSDSSLIDLSKIGIISASLVAGIAGYIVLRLNKA